MMRGLLTTIALLLALPASAGVRMDIETQLFAALEQAVDDPSAHIHIAKWQTSHAQRLRQARRVESIEILPGEKPWGRVTARAHLHMRDGGRSRVFVMADVEVRVPVWVVQRRIGRGAPLSATDVARELRALERLPSNAVRGAKVPAGRLAGRTLDRGQVLTQGSLTTPVIVKRGEDVSVKARVGNVRVRVRGRALKNGRIGDRINVRLHSKRVVSGRVEGPGEVFVR